MKSMRFLSSLALAMIAHAIQAADYPAVLDWSGRVSLAMPVSGVVENVAVQAGQRLKKGELMAVLHPTLFKAGVAEAKDVAVRLTQEEAEAQRDLERVTELYARTVSATTELDAAKLRHARVASGLAVAQARLEKARRQLEESELRAPFDAVVLARLAEPGLVAATPCQPNPLFTVASSLEYVARASLSPAQISRIKLGDKADVIATGASAKGEVRAISSLAEGKYGLEVAIPQTANLRAGQPVTIRLP
jgi:RND family efflux transporter MFP subunit